MAKYSEKYEGKYKDIISDWGNNSDCLEFETKIDEWLKQFEDEDRDVALRLLSKFQMYRRIYLENKIKELYERLLKYLKGERVNSFFMLLNMSDRLANSAFFASECKKTLENITIHQDIKSLTDEEIDMLNNRIILIDDYIGSGDSLINTIDYLIENHPQMRKFEFDILVINISELGLQNIKTYRNSNSLKIALAYCDLSSKAFKENYIFNTQEYETTRNKYKDLCDKYNIKFPFGYQETEALIAFDSCIPNNNLATFRDEGQCEGKKLNPLFKRKISFKDDITRHREQKAYMRRSEISIKEDDNFNFQTQIFVLYCAVQGKKLELGKACKLFGFTFSQFNSKLDFVLKNQLLIQAGEKFILGPNFEKSFKRTRLINSIIKNILNSRIYVDEKDFCDIINYTPIDFENRFKDYIEE